MIEFLRPKACVQRMMARMARRSARRQAAGRSRQLLGEHLEPRQLLTAVFAVTDTNELLRFDSAAPTTPVTIGTISGLQMGEQIQGIDFRPATGQLYALGIVDGMTTDEGRIYTIDIFTGAATQVGTAPFSTTLTDSADWGFDFNPVPDRIRIVNDGDQNLRAHPDTGALAATDTTLVYAVGDANNGADPAIVGSAYSNNVGGAVATTLYSIDFNGNRLVRQGGVEGSPSPNGGLLNTVGSLGVTLATSNVGLDIDSHTGRAFAAMNVSGATRFYAINLTNGAATEVATIGDGSFVVRDIAVINQPAASTATLYAVNANGQLLRFAANTPGTITTVGTISGLQMGEVIQGIDYRPATGELYALGIVDASGTDEGRVYKINTATAAATAVAGGAAPFSTLLANQAFYGFDFNPVPDRIRVVNNEQDNLRAHPVTGALAATDTVLAYDGSDPLQGQDPDIVGSAYTNSLANASATTLYAIDGNAGRLVRQGSLDSTPVTPNAGTLFSVGSLGVTLTSDNVGFDIRPGTGTAYAAMEVGGVTGLYTINVTTGAATLVGAIGDGSTEIVGLSTLPEGHFEVFLAEGGATATASVSGGNLVVRDGMSADLITPIPLSTVSVNSLRIFGGSGGDTITLDSSLNGVFTGRITVAGGNGNDTLAADAVTFGVTFDGGAGNDTASGGSGGDTLQGGDNDDVLYGLGGNDVLSGNAGGDIILGVTGNDTISGGAGTDFLNGGAQNDSLLGGDGDDVLEGGTGSDTLTGGFGTNSLRSDVATDVVVVSDIVLLFGNGNTFSSTVAGGSGIDVIRGTPAVVLSTTVTGGSITIPNYAGPASLIGSIATDSLVGGSGPDFIVAGSGNDNVDGGGGNDTIRGLAGNDTLEGGLGNDSVDGGTGLDSLRGDDGNDTLLGGDGNDTVEGEGGNDSIRGGIGNDFLTGGDGDDQVFGEAGNDTLQGGIGNDTLDGGDGNDGLSGFGGNDSLIGGAGRDTLIAGDGNDVLRGNGGDDIALGGDGDDSINGDAGTDTVAGNNGADRIIDPLNEIDEAFTFSAPWVEV